MAEERGPARDGNVMRMKWGFLGSGYDRGSGFMDKGGGWFPGSFLFVFKVSGSETYKCQQSGQPLPTLLFSKAEILPP